MKAVKEETSVSGKKLTAKKIEIAKAAPGYEWTAVWLGIKEGQSFQEMDKTTGELVSRTMLFALGEDENGERVTWAADKGFQQAAREADLQVGVRYKFVKLAKTNLSKARTMNQYDIYTA